MSTLELLMALGKAGKKLGSAANKNEQVTKIPLSDFFARQKMPISLDDLEVQESKFGKFVNIPHGKGRISKSFTLSPEQVFELSSAKTPFDIKVEGGGTARFLEDRIKFSDMRQPTDDLDFNSFGDLSFEDLVKALRGIIGE